MIQSWMLPYLHERLGAPFTAPLVKDGRDCLQPWVTWGCLAMMCVSISSLEKITKITLCFELLVEIEIGVSKAPGDRIGLEETH